MSIERDNDNPKWYANRIYNISLPYIDPITIYMDFCKEKYKNKRNHIYAIATCDKIGYTNNSNYYSFKINFMYCAKTKISKNSINKNELQYMEYAVLFHDKCICLSDECINVFTNKRYDIMNKKMVLELTNNFQSYKAIIVDSDENLGILESIENIIKDDSLSDNDYYHGKELLFWSGIDIHDDRIREKNLKDIWESEVEFD